MHISKVTKPAMAQSDFSTNVFTDFANAVATLLGQNSILGKNLVESKTATS